MRHETLTQLSLTSLFYILKKLISGTNFILHLDLAESKVILF